MLLSICFVYKCFNIVNIFNFTGAIAILTEIGLSVEQIEKGFSQSEIVKSRFDTLKAGNLDVTFIMAKGQNPIACARCFSYAAEIPKENKLLLIDIDDLHDNINESESTCWLYDCDYSYLADGTKLSADSSLILESVGYSGVRLTGTSVMAHVSTTRSCIDG